MKRAKVIGICTASVIAASAIFYSISTDNSVLKGTASNTVIAPAPDSIRTVDIHARYVEYDTADKLHQDADIVLVASPIDDFANREHHSTEFEDGTLQDFYTLTNLNVERIIKQPEGINIGSQMQVIEPVSIITEADKQQTKVAADGYREMKQGKRYIVFLKNNGMGDYSVINMNNGKFNLDGGDAQDVPTDANEKAFKERLKKDIQSNFSVK
ncbi:hypothetical protein [Lysinibacillus sp. NPDC056232]|uniref:hypothetical protein n=1 Tax=Lysinibacillus sp. NPDC056232 TaxID=3345756 RepID=UPI0035D8DE83